MGLLDPPGLTRVQANARYASKARLLARRLNHLSPVLPTQLTPDPPTVSIGTAQTIPGRFLGPLGGVYNVLGSISNWNASLGRISAPAFTGIDMILDGDAFEVRLFGQVTSAVSYFLRVDGQPVSTDAQTFDTTSNTTHYLKVAFPTARPRRVELVMGPIAAIFGVHVAHSTVVAPPPRRPKVAFVMDSFGAGSAGTPGAQAMAITMARMLNAECISASTGGTGYISGGTDTYGSAGRVTLVQQGSPDAIVVVGSVNDDGNSTAAVQAAATACYAALATACPGVPVIVLGSQPNAAVTTTAAARTAVNMGIKAAALAAPNVIAFHDMIGTADGQPPDWVAGSYNEGDKVVKGGVVWQVANGGTATTNTPETSQRWKAVTWAFTGSGKSGTPTGDGSRDFLLHSDNVHPTPLGTRALSEYAARAVIDSLVAA